MHFFLVHDFGWLYHSLAASTKNLPSNYFKKLKMTTIAFCRAAFTK